MTERLAGRAKEGHRQSLSYGLSSLALTRADVRAYSRLSGMPFDESAAILMRKGISGKDIEAKRGSFHTKMSRSRAAEIFLTPFVR